MWLHMSFSGFISHACIRPGTLCYDDVSVLAREWGWDILRTELDLIGICEVGGLGCSPTEALGCLESKILSTLHRLYKMNVVKFC